MRVLHLLKEVVVALLQSGHGFFFLIDAHALAEQSLGVESLLVVLEVVNQHVEQLWHSSFPQGLL